MTNTVGNSADSGCQPYGPIELARSSVYAWLAVIAVIAVLFIVPPTRWIVVQQAQWAFSRPFYLPHQFDSVGYDDAWRPDARSLAKVEADHENDYDVQLGCALGLAETPARLAALRSLASRFPNQPSLYAHILRLATISEVRLYRPEQDSMTGPSDFSPPAVVPPTPEALAAFDQAAVKGERLDPGNAYLPLMRAVGLFAAHRDQEAVASIEAAASMGRYDDYTQQEVVVTERLRRDFLGEHSALALAAIQIDMVYPHYTGLRGAAYVAAYKAMRAEQSGHQAKGLAIRHSVMRCGDLIRAESTTMIGALVGSSIAQIACLRPDGKPAEIRLAGMTERQYRIMPSGHWKPLAPASVSLQDAVATDSVVATHNGRFLYAEAMYYAFVALYRVGATGALHPLHPASAQADSHPGGIVIDPTGRLLYISCSHGDICEYRIASDGELAQIGTLYFDGAARDPTEVEFFPRGHRASIKIDDIDAAGRDIVEIAQLRVAPDGKLRIVGRRRVSAKPNSAA